MVFVNFYNFYDEQKKICSIYFGLFWKKRGNLYMGTLKPQYFTEEEVKGSTEANVDGPQWM